MGGCHEYFSACIFITEAAYVLKATLEERMKRMSANCRSGLFFDALVYQILCCEVLYKLFRKALAEG